jgi:hypothetical protein
MKERRLSSWGEMGIWRSGDVEAEHYHEAQPKPGEMRWKLGIRRFLVDMSQFLVGRGYVFLSRGTY